MIYTIRKFSLIGLLCAFTTVGAQEDDRSIPDLLPKDSLETSEP